MASYNERRAAPRSPRTPCQRQTPMPKDLRKIITSPTINTPNPFVGFGGFCGWPRICRLSNGDLYTTFSAGYWHASWVNPRPDLPTEYAEYMDNALPGGSTWHAPSGGHIMWTRSSDDGATWTPPRDLAVIPHAYAAGAIAQHSDGTLYAAALIQRSHFHAERIPQAPLAFLRTLHEHFPEEIAVLRSEDNGESWREVGRTSGPFLSRLENPCSITEAKDGSLLLLIDGHAVPGAEKTRWVNALLHSSDRGATWQTRSIFGHDDYDMEEGHLVYLPDGRLGTCSRPWGLWITSDDEGFTWSEPRAILGLKPLAGRPDPNGCKKGGLLVTSDGTVVLLTCGRPGGNGQVLYSRDSGETWIKPAPDRGFTTDRYAYYPGACLMPDDSIFMVGDHQGFANPYGPFGAEVIATRFRILAENEGEGIEIMRIDGALHEPWGEEQDGGEAADRKIEKDA
mgnify:FL=1|jgi:hypothetical protein